MFKILDEVCTPTRGTKYSAAVDLRAREDVVIGAGKTALVPLGIKIDEILLRDIAVMHYAMGQIPHRYDEVLDKFRKRHYLQLMLRSSLGKRGLILPNGVGIIDIDYKDEIMMVVHNPIIYIDEIIDFNCDEDYIELDYMGVSDSDKYVCSQEFTIKKGDRVAQITLLEHKSYLFDIDSNEVRNGGFGSTGSK